MRSRPRIAFSQRSSLPPHFAQAACRKSIARTSRSAARAWVAQRVGLQLAYDDVLVDACAALGVANTLTALSLGLERDAERLYVENLLCAAGLHL